MNIDWDSAPEATHYDSREYVMPAFMRKSATSDDWEYLGPTGWKFYGTIPEDDIVKMTARPSGSGCDSLPSVGTICGFRDSENSPWKKVEVRYISEMTVLLRFENEHGDNEGAYSPEDCQFCTLEQIAAEERETAIKQMKSELLAQPGNLTGFHEICSALYDANYRKRVTK